MLYSNASKCPITNSTGKVSLLDLGDMPLANSLYDTREESLACERYPLELIYYPHSKLAGIDCILPSDILFKTYIYYSGVNRPYADHCEEMYWCISSIRKWRPFEDVVVDIGGNDGTLIQQFRAQDSKMKYSLSYVNIDGSTSFIEENKKKEIEYVNEFWSEDFRLPRKANVIVSTNVFQHNHDVRGFVSAIRENLADDGIWCLEFPSFLSTLHELSFDQIYHEHMYYYLATSVNMLIEQEGLRLIGCFERPIHGGSLRLIMCKNAAPYETNSYVKHYIESESLMLFSYMINWTSRVHKHIHRCMEKIEDIKDSGKSIAAFGAAAKGNVFLNACQFTCKEIDFIIDDTPQKQGKYMGGTGIQIVGRSILKEKNPDYILILAHNFKQYIIDLLKEMGYTGKILVMIPEVKEYFCI